MSLIIKSQHNLDAATSLCTNQFYSPAVHCAYYSCYQLMIHLSNTKELVLSKQKKSGSHMEMINKITRLMKGKNKGKFNTIIKSLKELRVIADYNTKIITDSECEKSIQLSIEAQEILKIYFK